MRPFRPLAPGRDHLFARHQTNGRPRTAQGHLDVLNGLCWVISGLDVTRDDMQTVLHPGVGFLEGLDSRIGVERDVLERDDDQQDQGDHGDGAHIGAAATAARCVQSIA